MGAKEPAAGTAGTTPIVDTNAAGAGPTRSIADSTAIYTAYRAYIVHEDDLINQRTTWSMTAQGIMLAGFGYIYNARLTTLTASPTADASRATGEGQLSGAAIALQNYRLDRYDFLLDRICWVGIAVAVIALLSLGAALFAVHAAQRKLRGNSDPASEHAKTLYPDLTGGGSLYAHVLGFIYPLLSQAISIGFWIYALGMLT